VLTVRRADSTLVMAKRRPEPLRLPPPPPVSAPRVEHPITVAWLRAFESSSEHPEGWRAVVHRLLCA
jgi:hypothetical protein